jgi:Fe-S oxidoreductase
MSAAIKEKKSEGGLEAPTRHPIDWQNPDFYDQAKLDAELERVFNHCHGCRRCVSLCNSFPTLFDLVDESPTLEVDGVDKADYGKVVEHCYLCDLCYQTKCPYTPPHEWAIDFPHLMLRAKAVNFKQGKTKLRDRILTSTDAVGKLAGIPVVAQVVNATNRSKAGRVVLDKVLEVHQEARLPEYHSDNARKRLRDHIGKEANGEADENTRGRVALFTTCYCNRNEPDVSMDLVAVFEHNGIPVTLANKEQCCGMPKMELGDFESVARLKEANIPVLAELVDQGWDLTAPIPSCVLMFKKELPLLFPDDEQVRKVSQAFFDPFEYLLLRHKSGKLRTDFKHPLGKVAYHTPCHQRVQNIGRKTFDLLTMVPGTEIELIERCSGHDGTYAVKKEFHEHSMKIGRPVVNKVRQGEVDHFGSDCPMAGRHIQNGLRDGREPEHPLRLLRHAYGI